VIAQLKRIADATEALNPPREHADAVIRRLNDQGLLDPQVAQLILADQLTIDANQDASDEVGEATE